MTETISLSLAKEIAELYEKLGEDAALAHDLECYTSNYLTGKTMPIWRYNADELMDILPVGTNLAKIDPSEYYDPGKYEVTINPMVDNNKYGIVYANDIVEALGMMLCRVLDEQIKQKVV